MQHSPFFTLDSKFTPIQIHLKTKLKISKRNLEFVDLSQPVSNYFDSFELNPNFQKTYLTLIQKYFEYSGSKNQDFQMANLGFGLMPNSDMILSRHQSLDFCFFCGEFLSEKESFRHFRNEHGGIKALIRLKGKKIEVRVGKKIYEIYSPLFDIEGMEFIMNRKELKKIKKDIVNLNY